MNNIKSVLTIAGSDSSGGAGIQADLKTFNSRGVYGMSVITALTAQNTIGVQGIYNIDAEFVGKQIDSVMGDIRVDVWKTGMLANEEIIRIIVDKIKMYKKEVVVVDPVMVAKSGDRLLEENAQNALISKLIPLAYVLTPNIFEAEIIANMIIKNVENMYIAAKKIYKLGVKYVIIKGGAVNDKESSIDLLYDGKNCITYDSPRIESENTHGSGCTFASAIASELAKGSNIIKAVHIAKAYVTALINKAKNYHIGQGHGALLHFFNIPLELNLCKIKIFK